MHDLLFLHARHNQLYYGHHPLKRIKDLDDPEDAFINIHANCDDSRLVAASVDCNGTLRVWDLQRPSTPQRTTDVSDVAFHTASVLAISGMDETHDHVALFMDGTLCFVSIHKRTRRAEPTITKQLFLPRGMEPVMSMRFFCCHDRMILVCRDLVGNELPVQHTEGDWQPMSQEAADRFFNL